MPTSALPTISPTASTLPRQRHRPHETVDFLLQYFGSVVNPVEMYYPVPLLFKEGSGVVMIVRELLFVRLCHCEPCEAILRLVKGLLRRSTRDYLLAMT